jgi:hypothetical protein
LTRRVEEPSYSSKLNSSGAKLMFMLGKSPPSKTDTIEGEAGVGNSKVGQPSQKRWADDDDDEVRICARYLYVSIRLYNYS